MATIRSAVSSPSCSDGHEVYATVPGALTRRTTMDLIVAIVQGMAKKRLRYRELVE